MYLKKVHHHINYKGKGIISSGVAYNYEKSVHDNFGNQEVNRSITILDYFKTYVYGWDGGSQAKVKNKSMGDSGGDGVACNKWFIIDTYKVVHLVKH